MVRAGEHEAHDHDNCTVLWNTCTRRRPSSPHAGKLTGQKPALKSKEVWAIRARLELKKRIRDLALFNLAIDKLPGRTSDRGPALSKRRQDVLFSSKSPNRPVLRSRR